MKSLAGYEWEVEVGEDVDVTDGQQETPLHDQPDPEEFDADTAGLEKELDAAANAGIVIDLSAFSKTAAGLKVARLAFLKQKRARLNMKVARLRRLASDQKGRDDGGRLARAGTWRPENPVTELDVPRTFSDYGTFIPGVTTQRAKHKPDPRGIPRSQKFGHMNFIIDVSSSMAKGVSPTHPLDVRVKHGPDAPWMHYKPRFAHTSEGLWHRSQPLMPDPKGPKGGYPRFEVRVPAGLPNAGEVIDPTTIRRVLDVAVEVAFAMLQEARKRKNSVSVFTFDTVGRVEISKTRDHNKVEKILLTIEPDGNTFYEQALDMAAKDTQSVGGKALTVLITDASVFDLSNLAPAVVPEGLAASAARNETRQVALMRALTKAGPFFLVCLGQDPEKNAGLKAVLKRMRDEYGSNFEVGAFPDVSTEDAVFAAARWSVQL